MKIKTIKGDLLKAPEQLIAHGCNAQGVMGAGVAKQIKMWYAGAYEDYRQHYISNGLTLGYVIFSPVNNKIIANCITQQYYGRIPNRQYCSYDAIGACIRYINDYCKNNDIDAFALPKIGCSLAGGDWDIVSLIIEENTPDVQPIVYVLKPTPITHTSIITKRIPQASLRLMFALINPPKPIGCDVVVDGETVAVLTLEQINCLAHRIQETLVVVGEKTVASVALDLSKDMLKQIRTHKKESK